MSEVRHECGAAADAGDSGGVTAANGDSSGNALGDDSRAESSGGTATPSFPVAVPSRSSPSSPSAAPVQPGLLTITCKVVSGGAQLHASQPLNNTPVVLEFSSGREGVVAAGSGGYSALVPEPAAAGASSCTATPDSGDSD
jgi:hypothetical protein